MPQSTAYSGDGVYLYSTLDSPTEVAKRTSVVLSTSVDKEDEDFNRTDSEDEEPMEIDTGNEDSDDAAESDSSSAISEIIQSRLLQARADIRVAYDKDDAKAPKTPVILPRKRFSGHCNTDTIKDGMFESSTFATS